MSFSTVYEMCYIYSNTNILTFLKLHVCITWFHGIFLSLKTWERVSLADKLDKCNKQEYWTKWQILISKKWKKSSKTGASLTQNSSQHRLSSSGEWVDVAFKVYKNIALTCTVPGTEMHTVLFINWLRWNTSCLSLQYILSH